MANREFDDLDDSQNTRPKRYVSVDALRGFDMFWILGADALARSIPVSSGQLATSVPAEAVGDLSLGDRVIHHVAEQLEHVPWDGFHFYDLIFPLFVFVMGVSTVFSLDRIVAEHGKGQAYWRVFRRAAILYALGIFYHGGMGDPEQFRLMGVLHRIAICYLIGGILYLNLRWRGLLVISILLLGGYWGLMTFVHVPGHGPGNFVEGTNLANYIDSNHLPGYKWDGDWDPEGLLSTLPAIVSGLMGIFAGLLLRNRDIGSGSRISIMLGIGAVCIAAGYGWHVAPYLECPIIKKLWTPAFVLYAGGWSFILLAIFHAIIDVAKFDIWARPFVWIGMNPITLYMLGNMFGGYSSLVTRVVHDRWIEQAAPWGQLGVATVSLMIPIWIAWAMYRRHVFLRI
jgi:predicted acyltransferase